MLDKILNKPMEELFENWFQRYVDSDNFNEYIGFEEYDFLEEYIPTIEHLILDKKELENKIEKAKLEKIKDLAYSYFEYEYDNFCYDLESIAEYDNEGVIVYREITVDSIEKYIQAILNSKNYKSPTESFSGCGICWSWDENRAEAHWGNYSSTYQTILIKAKINYEYIEFSDTFLLNFDLACGKSEAEIRIKPNSPIKILEINDSLINVFYRT